MPDIFDHSGCTAAAGRTASRLGICLTIWWTRRRRKPPLPPSRSSPRPIKTKTVNGNTFIVPDEDFTQPLKPEIPLINVPKPAPSAQQRTVTSAAPEKLNAAAANPDLGLSAGEHEVRFESERVCARSCQEKSIGQVHGHRGRSGVRPWQDRPGIYVASRAGAAAIGRNLPDRAEGHGDYFRFADGR